MPADPAHDHVQGNCIPAALGDDDVCVEAEVPFIWCTYGFGTPEGYAQKVDRFEDLLNL